MGKFSDKVVHLSDWRDLESIKYQIEKNVSKYKIPVIEISNKENPKILTVNGNFERWLEKKHAYFLPFSHREGVKFKYVNAIHRKISIIFANIRSIDFYKIENMQIDEFFFFKLSTSCEIFHKILHDFGNFAFH